MTSEGRSNRRWFVWLATFITSLLPPLACHLLEFEALVESRRGLLLLPITLSAIRDLADDSFWIPWILVFLALVALKYRDESKTLICLAVFISAVFHALFAAVGLVVASDYIRAYSAAENEIRSLRASTQQVVTDKVGVDPPAGVRDPGDDDGNRE